MLMIHHKRAMIMVGHFARVVQKEEINRFQHCIVFN